ncbi:hypothetical protein MANES_14G125221v8 [Manihot esculenta]|uniref:Uncharacterized protein n=1 Tax=Manihot esculenta TaxID=3983 RepID=A0ACB7GHH2_MANES|nr:hypothetical protein MANES_14G125221v8 [Manihot esculenta]
MAKITPLSTFLVLLLFNLSSSFPSFSLAAPAPDVSVYESFLQCLDYNTNPQDQISDLVYSQAYNTSFLRAYIRNARWNTSTTPKPLIIITPKQIPHVQAAVVCTKKVGYQLKVRSGGHDYEGISYVSDVPFFLLDMFNLRSINVDVKTESAWVQTGATLGEVYYRIWEKSKVHGFPAGFCPTVGVGGHISGGGYGNMLKKYVLASDNVLDAQIIVTVFRVERTLDQNATTDVVYKWQLVAPKTDNAIFMRMLPITSNTNKNQKTIRATMKEISFLQTIVALYLGKADTLVSLLGKEFPELGLKKENCNETSWIQSVLWSANHDIGTSPDVLLDRDLDSASFLKRKSDYVQTPIPKDKLNLIFQKMIEVGKTGMVFNPYGGRMSEIPATKTPFPHRDGNLFKIQYSLKEARDLYSYMTPFVSKDPRRAFLNYRDLDIGVMKAGENSYKEGRVYGNKYFNQNFDRLVKVKTAIDPENFFRNEQSIPTLPAKL